MTEPRIRLPSFENMFHQGPMTMDENLLLRTLTPSASLRVYQCHDLRYMIMKQLGSSELLAMMRAQQAVMCDVARMLYRITTLKRTVKWSGDNFRGRTYLEQVSTLDISSPPRTDSSVPESAVYAVHNPRNPEPFVYEKVCQRVQELKSRFPSLRIISNRYPEIEGDDAWEVQLDLTSGAIETVLIETLITIDVTALPFRLPTFPPSPIFPGVTVRQVFNIHLVRVANACNTRAEADSLRERWRRWMMEGKVRDMVAPVGTQPVWRDAHTTLDERVCGVNQLAHKVERCTAPTIDGLMGFIEQRRVNNSQTISRFHLDPSLRGIPLDRLHDFTIGLGIGMRFLQFSDNNFGSCENLTDVLNIFDRAFPSLDVLRIRFSPRSSAMSILKPLEGFSGIRQLILDGLANTAAKAKPPFFCRIGSMDTVFQDTSLLLERQTRKFQKDMIAAKLSWIRARSTATLRIGVRVNVVRAA